MLINLKETRKIERKKKKDGYDSWHKHNIRTGLCIGYMDIYFLWIWVFFLCMYCQLVTNYLCSHRHSIYKHCLVCNRLGKSVKRNYEVDKMRSG